MTEDPREATVRDRILHGAYDSQGSRHHPRCPSRSAKGDCDCYMQERQPALDALASLARDARKAALAEAVVEAAEACFDGTLRVRPPAQLLYKRIAAFRAEFPADPQEKP